MKKIVFDLDELKEFLRKFDEVIEPNIAYGVNHQIEKVVYDIDKRGRIYSKRYIDDDLIEDRFDEFIRGEIVDNDNLKEMIAENDNLTQEI